MSFHKLIANWLLNEARRAERAFGVSTIEVWPAPELHTLLLLLFAGILSRPVARELFTARFAAYEKATNKSGI